MSYTMYMPTQVIFGKGKVKELHRQLMPGKKALLVISNGKSVKENGSFDIVLRELSLLGMEPMIFDQVSSNPVKSTVMTGAEIAKENQCDFVVALGGGSVLDAAKAIALMAVNTGDYWDYIATGTGKGKVIQEKPLPLIAIPTTAGTGSEVDLACVISNDETNEKIGLGHPALFPVLSIIDSELEQSIPSKFTAYQGFDALFHSMESYISNKANLMSEMYALTAIENITKYLPQAVADGSDIEARERIRFSAGSGTN